MENFNGGKAEFFAFISHKSSDKKLALKLQKFIESYNLPTEIRKNTNSPKRLFPLCAYEVDFSSNELKEEMNDKLKRSKYLIVICSEELIKNGTKYVNYEIETFMQFKREEGIDPLTRIIPIIANGDFDSEEHGCCPEALKALGDSCPIALDRQSYKNDRILFLHVISTLLGIDYTVLENRDKKRQRFRKTVGGVIAGLSLAVALCLGEYYIPREYHYLDFVMKYGLPQGIESLDASEYKKLSGHYVITKQKHKVQSLEYVNSHGKRINHDFNDIRSERPSAYIFDYNSSGLSSVTYENNIGMPIFIMQYSGKNNSVADLKDPYDQTQPYFIGNGYESDYSLLLQDYSLTSHSDISRFTYEYTEDGYIRKITFHADNSNRLAGDNSVYGFEYVLDEKGRINEVYCLNPLGERRLNSQGLYCRKYNYDENNNLAELINYGKDNKMVSDSNGIVRKVYEYVNHSLRKLSFYGENGEPMYVAAHKCVYQVQHRDSNGNIVRAELLDENGNLSDKLDYCIIDFTYDKNGFTESRTYLNANEEVVLDTSTNFAVIKSKNNKHGNPVESTYYDAQGNPVDMIYGYARVLKEYNDRGQVTKLSYFDIEGTPADYKGYGYSITEYTYDDRGRETSQSFYDGDGNAVNIIGPDFSYGYHKVETLYGYGAITKVNIAHYDANGQLVNQQDSLGESFATSEMYFQNGEITYSASYYADGNLYGNILESKTERNAKAQSVNTMIQKDSNENIVLEVETVYTIEGLEESKTFTEHGENGKVLSLSKYEYRDNGEYKTSESIIYDENGYVAMTYYDKYDVDGNITSSVMTDSTNALMPVTSKFYYTYYNSGAIHQRKIENFDADNTVTAVSIETLNQDGSRKNLDIEYYNNSVKSSKTVQEYKNNKLSAAENLTYYQNGQVKTIGIHKYDDNENNTESVIKDYRDDGTIRGQGIFTYHPDGTHTLKTTTYDKQENVIGVLETLYDADGNPIK